MGTEENIDAILKSFPTVLEPTDDVETLALYYLPYSTGFEIECYAIDASYDKDAFFNIPDVIKVETSKTSNEHRFRIPNGLKGLCCLHRISLACKVNLEFNPFSGIHYHVDCTDVYGQFSENYISNASEWVLKELDTWDYKGTYNPRICEFSGRRHWTRFKDSTQTMEFRIGEMTFEYELLFKRITHCNSIVRKLKLGLDTVSEQYGVYDEKSLKDIVKQRIIKI